jgi:hypothetical protein
MVHGLRLLGADFFLVVFGFVVEVLFSDAGAPVPSWGCVDFAFASPEGLPALEFAVFLAAAFGSGRREFAAFDIARA